MTEVWIADAHDLPALVDMGERFHAAARLPGAYNGEDFGVYCAWLVGDDEGVIFRTDGGMIGGHVALLPWDRSHRVATEDFWWSEDGHGAALLSAFEEWGLARANEVRMSLLTWLKPVAIARVLSMRGYQGVEMGMSKWP